jgi:small-conductance mechanosensitive channel
MNLSALLKSLTDPLIGILILAASLLVGFLISALVRLVVRPIGARSHSVPFRSVIVRFRRPNLYFFPLLAAAITMSFVRPLFPQTASDALSHVVQVLFIAWATWALSKVFYVIEDVVFDKYSVNVKDNLHARKVRTQTQFMKRLGSASLAILGFGIALTTFAAVRQVGTTLLASAGVVGIIMGFAAQKALGLVIAGFQVAFTQPIRIDDVVIAEGEWGRIEEITLTYVVVRIWDLRRLVLPINYFIDKPFQNWTRVSADLLGTVFLYLDYSVPVEEIRNELRRLLEDSPLWDRTVCVVQVTDATAKAMEVRLLMSASDSGTLWDLRCLVREQMILFVQEHYPESLPFLRTDYRDGRGEPELPEVGDSQ